MKLFIGSIILLILATSASIFIVKFLTDNILSLPYTIIETKDNPADLAEWLSKDGELVLIWQNSATIPFSHFDTLEMTKIDNLANRNFDPRVSPQIDEILAVFNNAQDPLKNPLKAQGRQKNSRDLGSLENNIRSTDAVLQTFPDSHVLYAFNFSRSSMQMLESYTGDYSLVGFESRLLLFRIFLFLIITCILLLVYTNSKVSLLLAIIFLPLFFSFQLALFAAILLPMSRELLSRSFFTPQTWLYNQRKPRAQIPTSKLSAEVRQLLRTFYNHFPQYLYIYVFVFVVLCIYGIIIHVAIFLYIILSTCLVFFLYYFETKRKLEHIEGSDHPLFRAQYIIPKKHISTKKEAISLLLITILAISIISNSNFSLSSGRLYQGKVIGTSQSPEDQLWILSQILERIETRLEGKNYYTTASHPMLVILLADRAYQQLFPYLGISSSGSSARYEDGTVYLNRFEIVQSQFSEYEEPILTINWNWINRELQNLTNYDMLGLYSHNSVWYDTKVLMQNGILQKMEIRTIEILLITIPVILWVLQKNAISQIEDKFE